MTPEQHKLVLDALKDAKKLFNSEFGYVSPYIYEAIAIMESNPVVEHPPKELVKQLVEALEAERIMGKDSEGNYTIEVTPRRITEAIAAGRAWLDTNKQGQT